MLTRTMTATVLPRKGRLRARLSGWRSLRGWLGQSRRQALVLSERADSARERCTRRHGYGRRS
jgi:hypothetical protein